LSYGPVISPKKFNIPAHRLLCQLFFIQITVPKIVEKFSMPNLLCFAFLLNHNKLWPKSSTTHFGIVTYTKHLIQLKFDKDTYKLCTYVLIFLKTVSV